MKKILIFAAIIFLCVLIIYCLFFIGNIGNFAQLLGEEAKEIIGVEENKFIGTWELIDAPGEHTLTFFSNGNFSKSDIDIGIYRVEDRKIILTSSPDGYNTTHKYYFSDDNTLLTLKELDGEQKIYAKL